MTDRSASPDGAATLLDGVRDRADRFRSWSRRLAHELAQLPDTLAQLREGVADFKLVGERLAESSEALEEMTALYQSTLASTTRRSAEAAEALRSQVESLVDQSPERLTGTLAEMQRTFESLAELNPWWPRGPKRPGRDR